MHGKGLNYTYTGFAWFLLVVAFCSLVYAISGRTWLAELGPDAVTILSFLRSLLLAASAAIGFSVFFATGANICLAAGIAFLAMLGNQVVQVIVQTWTNFDIAPAYQNTLNAFSTAMGMVIMVFADGGKSVSDALARMPRRKVVFAAVLLGLLVGCATYLLLRIATIRGFHTWFQKLAFLVVPAALAVLVHFVRRGYVGNPGGMVLGLAFFLFLSMLNPLVDFGKAIPPNVSLSWFLDLCAIAAVPYGFAIDGIEAIRHTHLLAGTAPDPAYRDPLTGLSNRRALDSVGESIYDEYMRTNRPVSILMMDLDHFKRVNDLYGHPAGDCVLRQFADILSSCVRTSDLTVRYGGEEFVALLPGAVLAAALRLAERVRTQVEQAEFDIGSRTIRLTVTIGAATAFPGETDNFAAILAMADRNLYRAKRAGRNRILANPITGAATDIDEPAD